MGNDDGSHSRLFFNELSLGGALNNLNNKPSIVFKNVTKSFGETTVLHDLSFEIESGSITTIIGFSGAGKSTLLKHILGLLSPSSGSVNVLGTELSTLADDKLRIFRKNFGMVFQYAALFDGMSSFENVAFPMREFTKLSESEIREKVSDLYDAVGLDPDSMGRLPSELSGGMRKRVGLARALALNPKVMLYDEPTTGLDPITTKMVNDLVYSTARRYRSEGFTSVIISHDVKATLQISDYVAFLERGRIVEYLPTQDFKNSKNEKVREFLDLSL